MKTFQQFMEQVTPKQMDVVKSDTRFRSEYPVPFNFSLPQAKKKSDKNIKTA